MPVGDQCPLKGQKRQADRRHLGCESGSKGHQGGATPLGGTDISQMDTHQDRCNTPYPLPLPSFNIHSLNYPPPLAPIQATTQGLPNHHMPPPPAAGFRHACCFLLALSLGSHDDWPELQTACGLITRGPLISGPKG